MAKPKRRPSEAEMDERFKIELPPDVAIHAILETGPHPEDEEDQDDETE